MRPSLCLLKQSSSSTRWIARQAKDPYVKARSGSEAKYRSRSSFKLLSICDKHKSLLAPGKGNESKVVVDLGAAPGGWSQVARSKLGKNDLVFALDILEMDPINGVEVIRGDFLSQGVQEQLSLMIRHKHQIGEGSYDALHKLDDGVVDLVMSDMMGPMSGNRLHNVRTSLDLVEAASQFAFRNLKRASAGLTVNREDARGRGGNLIMKFFMHPDMDEFQKEELKPRFEKVVFQKPKESRKESSEAYWICLGYKG